MGWCCAVSVPVGRDGGPRFYPNGHPEAPFDRGSCVPEAGPSLRPGKAVPTNPRDLAHSPRGHRWEDRAFELLPLTGCTAAPRELTMRHTLLPLTALAALGLSTHSFAQDTCSTPLDVGSALGSHSWTYTVFTPSTDSGFDGTGSCQGEFLSIYNDAFFLWTAPSTGHYRFQNEFMGDDPELAIYRGTNCSAFCVAYDSDSGPGYTSELVLQNVTAGEVFLVQVGTWLNDPDIGLTVGFDVQEVALPCLEPDDVLDDNDSCAEALAIDPGFYSNLRVAKTDPDLYRICLPAGGMLDVELFFWDTEGDVDLFLYEAAEVGCGDGAFGPWLVRGYTTTDNEVISYTNASGGPMNLVIHVELWSGSPYNECTDYALWVNGGERCDDNPISFCEPMSVNSTGVPTRLRGSGLHLEATQGPPNQFGYFLVGTGTSPLGTTAISEGFLCLSLAGSDRIGRYNVSGSPANSFGQFDALGRLANIVGTSSTGFGFDVPSSVPLSGNPTIQAGQTWHFQLWHREDGGDSNFSNGLSVSF